MATEEPAQLTLLDLPDPCLLKVLQCHAAGDQRSLFSAARAHSRLQQLAVMALHRISAIVAEQQQADSVLVYLNKHGHHVDSLQISNTTPSATTIVQLPPNLQLSSLQLGNLRLQLQLGSGCWGVLVCTTIKQLQLRDCRLLDAEPAEALTAALSQLPDLEHLSISFDGVSVRLSLGMLLPMQQLTYLELSAFDIFAHEAATSALQPLQALTRLRDLRLGWLGPGNLMRVTASCLSGTTNLTRLECSGHFEPGVLAGKTQHLQLTHLRASAGAAGEAQLLSHLQPLQQLTHLNLTHSFRAFAEGNPPAVAYSTNHHSQQQAAAPQHQGVHAAKRCMSAPVPSWQAAAARPCS
jgi:hypothetical protein